MYKMSGIVTIRYCSAPIVLQYTVGSAMASPSYLDKVFPGVVGVEQVLEPSISVFFNKSAIYLNCVKFNPVSFWKASIPRN